MKENRKLLKEVLEDIRHDMTDEEVLNMLADSKISVSPQNEKENPHSDSEPPIPLRNLREAGHSSFRLQACLFCG